jgi:hypothetical protein
MTKLVSDSRLDQLCAGWGKDGEIGMLTPLGNEIRDCLLELRELRRVVEPTCMTRSVCASQRAQCLHEHQMAYLVDRYQGWRKYECPYCELDRLRTALEAIRNELAAGAPGPLINRATNAWGLANHALGPQEALRRG